MTMSCLRSIYAGMSVGRLFLAVLLLAAIILALWTLPVEQVGFWEPNPSAQRVIGVTSILAAAALVMATPGSRTHLDGYLLDLATLAKRRGEREVECRTFVRAAVRGGGCPHEPT